MSDVLGDHDAVALAELVRSGQASPRELTEAAIARVEARNGALNAVIIPTFEKALAQSDGDLPDGPFRGVPIVIKNLWASVAGDPMHNGMAGMVAENYTPDFDSDIVARYRQAGFVFIGHTNTPELGLVATTEPLTHGPCRNPWNPDYGSGGSSGGSAAAVAAGMVPVGHASDGGGSIRIPAAMCGLVGLKPSRGRVPMGPFGDEWGVAVQHIVSRSVRDTAAVLDISIDPAVGQGVVAPPPSQPYLDEVGRDPGSLRIGLLTDSSRDDVTTDPACVAATERMAATLEGLGHRVERAHPAALVDPVFSAGFLAVWSVGAANNLNRIGDLIGRPLTADDVEPATWLMAEHGRQVSATQYSATLGQQTAFRRAVAEWWHSGFDLLLTPTTAAPPPPIGELTATADDPHRGSSGSIPYVQFTSPFNVTGQPAISIPAGTTDDGLPVGAQLVGAYGREDLLMQVAAQIETASPWPSID